MARTHRAFTLVELLVVITILVVLLALLTPSLDQAIYQAQLAQCAGNQRLIGTAVINYAFDNKRRYPERHIPSDDSSVSNYNTASLLVAENPASDMRPALRTAGLKVNQNTQCVFVERAELEENIPNEFLYGNQSLWFGWHYNTAGFGQGGVALPGMKKYGDKLFAWDPQTGGPNSANSRKYNLNLLASDFDVFRGSAGWIASHPDRDGRMFNWKVKQENFFGAFTITFSWWSAPPGPRGGLDLNFTYDDGSTRRMSDVRQNDPRVIYVWFAHQNREGGLQQVPWP